MWHDPRLEGEPTAEAIVYLLILSCVVPLTLLSAFLLFFKRLLNSAILCRPLPGCAVNLNGTYARYFVIVVLVMAPYQILFPPSQICQIQELPSTVPDPGPGRQSSTSLITVAKPVTHIVTIELS
jgi:hypothetical protein